MILEAYQQYEDNLLAIARDQGRQLGERALLLRQLERKFGPLPPDALTRLEAAEVPTLELFADRVLTATSLVEVLGE